MWWTLALVCSNVCRLDRVQIGPSNSYAIGSAVHPNVTALYGYLIASSAVVRTGGPLSAIPSTAARNLDDRDALALVAAPVDSITQSQLTPYLATDQVTVVDHYSGVVYTVPTIESDHVIAAFSPKGTADLYFPCGANASLLPAPVLQSRLQLQGPVAIGAPETIEYGGISLDLSDFLAMEVTLMSGDTTQVRGMAGGRRYIGLIVHHCWSPVCLEAFEGPNLPAEFGGLQNAANEMDVFRRLRSVLVPTVLFGTAPFEDPTWTNYTLNANGECKLPFQYPGPLTGPATSTWTRWRDAAIEYLPSSAQPFFVNLFGSLTEATVPIIGRAGITGIMPSMLLVIDVELNRSVTRPLYTHHMGCWSELRIPTATQLHTAVGALDTLADVLTCTPTQPTSRADVAQEVGFNASAVEYDIPTELLWPTLSSCLDVRARFQDRGCCVAGTV